MIWVVPLGGIVLLGLWVAILQRWQRGMYMLFLYLPVAGYVTLLFWPASYPALFKDLFFVIPTYLVGCLRQRDLFRHGRVPLALQGMMLALVVLVLVQMLNPGVYNWVMAAIGAKLWLFYMPLILLASAMIRDRDDLLRVCQVLTVVAWFPCIVGLIQWISILVFGYEWTMFISYGDAAYSATQRFTRFYLGGFFYRIPSTFSFVTQYLGFLMAMLVPAYCLMRLSPSKGWQRFGMLSLGLLAVSSFLSGSRGAFVFMPLIIFLIYLIEGRISGLVMVAILIPLLSYGAVSLVGVDPRLLFYLILLLLRSYAVDIVYGMMVLAFKDTLWGLGTGTNTGPARMVLGDPRDYALLENYYAKAAVELGIVGLLVVVAIFLTIIVLGFNVRRRLSDQGLRGCAAAFLAFFIAMAVNSFKGWQNDLDPVNVYFWVYAGFLFKLPYLDPAYRWPVRAVPRPVPATVPSS